MKARQLRRWHRTRLVRRWLDRLRHTWGQFRRDITPEQLELMAIKRASTSTPCSCWMCCNARANGYRTKQEHLAELREKEELEEK